MDKRELWLTGLSFIGMFLLGLPALAENITVDTTADVIANDGSCSLREAIIAANTDTAVDTCPAGTNAAGGDTIILQAGKTYTLSKDDDGGGHETDSGANNDDLDITGGSSEITIQGNGAIIERSMAVACNMNGVAEAGEFRIFEVASGGNLTLQDVTVRNGCADGDWRYDHGSGISNEGTMTITNSTLSGNSAAWGGGIGNWFSSSTVTIKNSIVGDNLGLDCWLAEGTFTPSGANFATDGSCTGFTQVNPAQLKLGSLANNGGPTQTHALLSGSVAIDAATDCTLLDGTTPVTQDQRGVSRPQGSACDAGAYEARFFSSR